jgi:hypothetical protein
MELAGYKDTGQFFAVQALQLALQRIGTTLELHNRETGGTLYWIEEGNPDLGFPLIPGRDPHEQP